MNIRDYIPNDWPEVEAIYWQGIKTRIATFDTKPRSQEAWESGTLDNTQRVAIADYGRIAAIACLWPTSARHCYRGVVEVSIYVHEDFRGNGLGVMMLLDMNDIAESSGHWMQQAAISSDNKASIRAHEKAGYRIVGTREKIAEVGGVWSDTVLMERRSRTVNWPV